MRTLNDIKQELEQATARRALLWEELSTGADAEKSAEVARLNVKIRALWEEARAARVRLRFGPAEEILARARAEERLDRQLAKVA